MLARWLILLVALFALLASPLQPSHPFEPITGGEHWGALSQRILLLTAHPDDECLFFSPTVLALIASNVTVFSFCLSNGNADGIGHIREAELQYSLETMGIPLDRQHVVNHPDLQDDITLSWNSSIVAEVLKPVLMQHQITTILTFDHHGISAHPNHISLPFGVSYLLSHPHGLEVAPRLYTLASVPLYSKYVGPLAPLLIKLLHPLSGLLARIRGGSNSTNDLTFVAGIHEYATAHQAMQQHWSQLVWFRWLYVLFSRYMWVNEWVEVTPSDNVCSV